MSQPDAEIDREKAQLGPSADGTVMLDLGGDIGALVLHTGPELHLAEIDISRVDGARPLAEGYELPHQHGPGGHSHGDDQGHSHGDDQGHSHDDDHGHSHGGAADGVLRTHVAVRERRGPAGVRYAAIYAGLLTGDYQLWNLDGTPADVVTIVGGQVTELHW